MNIFATFAWNLVGDIPTIAYLKLFVYLHTYLHHFKNLLNLFKNLVNSHYLSIYCYC